MENFEITIDDIIEFADGTFICEQESRYFSASVTIQGRVCPLSGTFYVINYGVYLVDQDGEDTDFTMGYHWSDLINMSDILEALGY